MQYRTILIDPPWRQKLIKSVWKLRPKRAQSLPYETMTFEEIAKLPVPDLADPECHLWLWTTNQTLRDGFDLIDTWGFKYLAPITWVKPSGLGNYFIHRTQTILFAYNKKCKFNKARYKPTVLVTGIPKRHSQKPEEFYKLIEDISEEPRLELFARSKRDGWDVWGNEVESNIQI